MQKINLDYQLLFVKFPIIFPLIYAFILYQFPNFESELIILTILILAETHFAATWPFLIDKVNSPYFKKYRVSLMVVPIIIVIFSFLAFFTINKLFLLCFFAANMYHVTRQSFGVSKLYCKNINENKTQEISIYFFAFLFFLIGFFRFYLPLINEKHILTLNLIIGFLLISFSIFYLLKYKYSENFLIFLTGCLIFYPICFVNNFIHAIIMGVTMHFTQYLYLVYNIYDYRKKDKSKNIEKSFLDRIYNYLIIIFLYSLIMTAFSFFGEAKNLYLKNLIIVPIIGQMLHFYLDSQLWKFSEKYNRDNTLFYINKFIK